MVKMLTLCAVLELRDFFLVEFLVSLRDQPTVVQVATDNAFLTTQLRLIVRCIEYARYIRQFALVILVTVDVACGNLRVVRVRPVARKIVSDDP